MTKTILVVEDNDGRRKAMVDVLTAAGYEVIAGEDFGAALHMVERLGIDVMISDLNLPAATPHGAALERLAQRKQAPLKLLFVSRVPVAADRAPAHARDILPMPLDRGALLDKVRALLAR
jgi:CheY-like chemotaxis protein